jgi:hypothetical protein
MALPVGKSIRAAGGKRIQSYCINDLPVKCFFGYSQFDNPYLRDHRAKTHPMAYKRHFYLKRIIAEFAPSS